jgi:hypothetical protein
VPQAPTTIRPVNNFNIYTKVRHSKEIHESQIVSILVIDWEFEVNNSFSYGS